MSQNLPKRSLGDVLSLRHPNLFVLAGANNRDVIITYRFLAAPVLVCNTAVFSVVTQRSSPLTAAENRTTFLSRD